MPKTPSNTKPSPRPAGKAAGGKVAGGKAAGKTRSRAEAPRQRSSVIRSRPASPKKAGQTTKSGTPNHTRQLNLVYFLLFKQSTTRYEDIAQIQGYSDLYEVASRQPVTKEVQRAKKSLRRRFERDRAELKEIGIEIASRPYLGGGKNNVEYYLANESLYAKPLKLVDEELMLLDIIMDGFRGEQDHELANLARSALIKLKCSSDSNYQGIGKSVATPRKFTTSKSDGDQLDILQAARAQRRTVSFKYRSKSQTRASTRKIEPYGFVQRNGVMYMVGRAIDKDELRIFRVSRIQDAIKKHELDEFPAFTVPKDFDLHETFSPDPFSRDQKAAKQKVSVHFDADVGFIFANTYEGQMLMNHRKDGSLVVHFESVFPMELFRVLAEYAGHFTILKQTKVKSEIAAHLRDTLGVYLKAEV